MNKDKDFYYDDFYYVTELEDYLDTKGFILCTFVSYKNNGDNSYIVKYSASEAETLRPVYLTIYVRDRSGKGDLSFSISVDIP